jgi:integrase
MPTMRKDNNNSWMARVVINGQQYSKMFPPGKKGGPEWREAKQWEEEKKNEIQECVQTLSDFELLKEWLRKYLEHSRRRDSKKTISEKEMVLCDFSQFCITEHIDAIEKLTPGKVQDFLAPICDARGPGVANRYFKNLQTAWRWGAELFDGFPQIKPPFRKEHRYAVDAKERYVPPAEEVVMVLEQAKGQDLVMLLTFYFTGGRAGEIFRLTWADVDLDGGRIRLADHKGGGGKKRSRWIQMHPELLHALKQWQAARPCRVDNVFMQLQSESEMGKPFTHRSHYMPKVCKRLGIKPFGFHALRHKSAAITFISQGLNAAQTLMGHYRATTTDRYVASAGLYMSQGGILDALGSNEIGQAIGSLLEKAMPLEEQTQEALCNTEHVTNILQ